MLPRLALPLGLVAFACAPTPPPVRPEQEPTPVVAEPERPADARETLLVVAGQPSGSATLWLDDRTGLPLEREQTVRFDTGTMRLIERDALEVAE